MSLNGEFSASTSSCDDEPIADLQGDEIKGKDEDDGIHFAVLRFPI